MAETILNLSNVSSSHKEFAVEQADFTLRSGDIMGLVGKSGSGKSTLIETILGIQTQDSGTIWVQKGGEEKPIRDVSGYSPQDNSLYPFMSVEENLKVFGKLRGLSKSDIENRSKQLLEKLEIYGDREKIVSELSGGMKKRADLAASLLHDPQLIMLDEPFAGIDPPQRKIIWNTLQSSAREGKIIVVTSHLIGEMTERCSKFGLIHEGKFYRSEKISQLMNDTNYQNIENFLNDVFRF